MTAIPTPATEQVRTAREFLTANREDYPAAIEGFEWPHPDEFNFGYEWFDVIAAEHPDRAALSIAEEDGAVGSWTYGRMSARSDQVAGYLTTLGVVRGDRIILMLGNQLELWEVILAAIKIGAVMIPASTLLSGADLLDRVDRGHAKFVIARSADTAKFVEGELAGRELVKVVVGGDEPGWLSYSDADTATDFTPTEPTPANDTLLLYFTSGTTALPKLVEHTHISYPIGHLSTAFWIGLRPGDVHLNISSPGWAKHAWSNVFAPWLAGATVFVYNYTRFDARSMMRVMEENEVSTFCAPPTVWRMLIQADLTGLAVPPREVVGAGEPLNPEVIEQVRAAWGVTIRDGFGQTEMSLAIGNSPGQLVKPGSMGRPLPGFKVALIDPSTDEISQTGEICLDLSARPLSLMAAYHGDAEMTEEAMRNGYYHTGDVGSIDDDGYITYVGRADDVFKASDYRISPFELESVLLEHDCVAEAAVVPSPDAVRLAVAKAYVALPVGREDSRETAAAIFAYSQSHLVPYKRIRRLEFFDLPKTISGKIRRVELREREEVIHGADSGTPAGEYRIEDFPELR